MAHGAANLVALYSFSKSFCIPGHRGVRDGQSVRGGSGRQVMDNLQIWAPRDRRSQWPALGELTEWRQANRIEISSRAQSLRDARGLGVELAARCDRGLFRLREAPICGPRFRAGGSPPGDEVGVLTVPGSYFGGEPAAAPEDGLCQRGLGHLGQLSTRLKALGG